MKLLQLRQQYHKRICAELLSVDRNGVPSNADKHSDLSVELAKGIVKEIGFASTKVTSPGQTSGKLFELITLDYLEKAFKEIQHLRPGKW